MFDIPSGEVLLQGLMNGVLMGCIYALMTALPGTKGELLGYHQASHAESGTAVTCSAVAFWEA